MVAEEKTYELRLDTTRLVLEAKAVTGALKGLESVAASVGQSLREAFSVKGYGDYKNTVTRFGKSLADALLVLQLRFGAMKHAIADAVAPLAAVFVPMLNAAMLAVIRFAGVLGQLFRALLGAVTGQDAMAASAQDAARREVKLGKAAKASTRALRRSLASFDEIQRLNKPPAGGSSGGGGGSVSLWGGYSPDPISPQVQAMVDKLLALLAPLLAIDLEPLRSALQKLWLALSQLAEVAGQSLHWLWYEILTPFIAWIMEKLAPALTECFAAKLELVTAAISPLVAGTQILWEALKPVVAYIGQAVIGVIGQLQTLFLSLAATFREKSPAITAIFQNLAAAATAAWALVQPVLTALGSAFRVTFESICQAVNTTVGFLLDALVGLTGFLAGAFSGDWKKAWEGIKSFLKNVVNGIIGLLNAMISRLVTALNTVVRAANKLSFTLPAWIPEIGGRTFGVNLRTVSAPKIPYLAQGAVLPANKPFMAVVGDQRHGTNIEAPLATIQEAVAMVMGDQLGAMLAGFEALLEENRQLRRTVQEIRIGDSIIGRAAERYQQEMAIMRGG